MPGVKLRLPQWSAHPGFGVGVLLALAVALIIHGEPQPSSRPSGTSVVVATATPSPVVVSSTLLVRANAVEFRSGSQVRRVGLPAGVSPLSVLTAHGLSVVLGLRDGVQRAYGLTPALTVIDLGPADGVIAGAVASTAIVIERAVDQPGRVLPTPLTGGSTSARSSPTVSQPKSASPANAGSSATLSPSALRSSIATVGPVPVRDYVVRRYDPKGQLMGSPMPLPTGMRVAVDTAVGLVAWRPVGVVVDRGQIAESLSATATLIRPDGSLRVIGAVHPLAATSGRLLVWDVARGEFGLMGLAQATAETTRVASSPADQLGPTGAAPIDIPPAASVALPSPSSSPTTVAGTKWFEPTRGFVVTGPATFSPDGSAFAAYAQVGSRRRLVVGRVAQVDTAQIEVLALAQPVSPASGTASNSPSAVGVSGTVSASVSGTAAITVPSASSSRVEPTPVASGPTFGPEGFPVSAPAAPLWAKNLVIAVAADGTIIGYVPGRSAASVLDFGATNVRSLAAAP